MIDQRGSNVCSVKACSHVQRRLTLHTFMLEDQRDASSCSKGMTYKQASKYQFLAAGALD